MHVIKSLASSAFNREFSSIRFAWPQEGLEELGTSIIYILGALDFLIINWIWSCSRISESWELAFQGFIRLFKLLMKITIVLRETP
jgi:hypothetical protein